MRILMLAQFYPPIVGGEEQHVQNLARALATRGHRVALATLAQAGRIERDRDGAVQLYRLPGITLRAGWLFKEPQRRHAPPFPDPETVAALRQVLDEEQPQIVHAHNWLAYAFMPLKARSQIRFIWTLHDQSLVCVQKRLRRLGALCDGPAFGKCLRCAAQHYGPLKGSVTLAAHRASTPLARKSVDMFIAVSQSVADNNRLSIGGRPYAVIPNFISESAEVVPPANRQLTDQLPRDDFLLFVGDLSQDKGLNILCEAYAGLATAPPLVLIGREVADTSWKFPPGVIYLGSWPHAAVMEAWRRCSIALAPSTGPEAFGTVVIEAMSCGRPVIATRIGGFPDVIVHDKSGLLVPPGDVLALRAAIQHLLTNPEDRIRLGKGGEDRVNSHFRAEAVVSKIENIYREVLSNSTASAQMHGRVRHDSR